MEARKLIEEAIALAGEAGKLLDEGKSFEAKQKVKAARDKLQAAEFKL